jgi:hypothetical protein
MEKFLDAILEETLFVLILNFPFRFWAFHRHTLVLILALPNLVILLIKRKPLTLDIYACTLLSARDGRL